MSTYLQGVTDYIPEYQPFQPDLNFYGNLMQAKQSIYDQNYKALSNVYNQLYSAELTNKENIKNRDELLKQLDFNLNRIAGLDLSLEQNVEQAKQVFKPFYENRSLMRDMAYTKNWNNTYSSAQALKTSQDEKQRKQYWDEGIRKMQYEREAFANANLDDILNMQDSTYTPRVDVPEMYQKLAKDMDLSVDITETDGRYFVRQKNGPLLQAPLTQLFASKLNSDPAVQEYYRTKAYVNRMDTAHANKDKYGSIEEAEREYLRTNYNLLKEQVKIQNNETQEIKNTVQAKLDNVTNDVKNGQINEHTEGYVQSLEEALGMVTVNAEVTQNLANELDDKPSSNSISSSVGDGLDLSNLELARMKVDMGIANSYANNDINQQAYLLAHKDMIKDISADPYGVAAQNHAYRSAEESQRSANRQNEIMMRAQLQENLVKLKANIDNKTLIPDGQGGFIPNPALTNPIISEGNSSAKALNAEKEGIVTINKKLEDSYTGMFSPMINKMLSYISGVGKADKLTNDQLASMFLGKTDKEKELDKKVEGLGSGIMGSVASWLIKTGKEEGLNVSDLAQYLSPEQIKRIEKESGRTLNTKSTKPIFNYNTVAEFEADFKKNPSKFLTARGGEFLRTMYDNTIKYAQENQGAAYHDEFIKSTAPERADFNEFTLFLDQKQDVLKSNIKAINEALGSSTIIDSNPKLKAKKDEILRLAINENGSLLSREAFITLMTNMYGDQGFAFSELTSVEGKRLSQEQREAKNIYMPQVGYLSDNKEKDYGFLYDELASIYKNTVSDAKVMRSYVEVISDKGQSLLANKDWGYNVFLGSPNTPGFGGFMQFMQNDYANINWSDDKNNNISIFGYTKSGVKDTQELFGDTGKLKGISDRILQDLWSKVGDGKAPTFILQGSQYALESGDKGAMIIKPTAEILKPYLESKTINQEMYDAMLLNGISYISDRSNFTNSIFNANKISPMQGMINSLRPGETYTYTDPTGKGGYNISKDPYGVSEYKLEAFINDFYMADGTKQNMVIPYAPQQIGNNIAPMLLDLGDKISIAAKASTDNFRLFHQGNTQNK